MSQAHRQICFLLKLRTLAKSTLYSMLICLLLTSCASTATKYGYIDTTGRVVIKPQFSSAREFSEGLAAIHIGNKSGYINRSGDIVIKPQFDDAEEFSEGIASVTVDGNRGYINKKGNQIIPPQFGAAGAFHEGLAAVTRNDGEREGWVQDKTDSTAFHSPFNWRYIDATGKVVIPPKAGLDFANQFSEGLAAVQLGKEPGTVMRPNKWGYLDLKGAVVIEPFFDESGDFSEGFARVKLGDKWGFVDKTGKIIIKPSFESAGDFSDGLAAVKLGGKYGFIDKTGRTVIEPQFSACRKFSDGLACVTTSPDIYHQKWGYIDKSGKSLPCSQFDAADDFSEGLAKVSLLDRVKVVDDDLISKGGSYNTYKSGYIDKTGKMVMKPQFSEAGRFKDGLAYVLLEP